MFPIAGHPIIEHCFRAVAAVPDIKEVFIVGYYEESVFQPFINTVSTTWPQLSVKYLREYQALGTAGGLYSSWKVWLESVRPGKPLAFLDSKIKVGNALLG